MEEVKYDTVLKLFDTYQEEQLTPSYRKAGDKSIRDTVRSGSRCAYDMTSNYVYYGQESYHCSTELLSHILRTSSTMLTYSEYQALHSDMLLKMYPDAPVLIQTEPQGKMSEGMKRLASLGVKIQ